MHCSAYALMCVILACDILHTGWRSNDDQCLICFVVQNDVATETDMGQQAYLSQVLEDNNDVHSYMLTVKSKVVPYSITSVAHGADPGLLAVSPQVT